MKDVVCIIDDNEKYVKRLNNYAIKRYGKEYLFLSFSNIKSLIEYTENNKVKGIVISSNHEKEIKFLKSALYCVLTEKKDKIKRDGNTSYIYKYQCVDNILEYIDNNIKNYENKVIKSKTKTKIIAFYSPYQTKEKIEKINKIHKYLSKQNNVLLIELDEFKSYKKDIGLSNIIYKYKENLLNENTVNEEISKIDELKYLNGVSYPEDFSVINNIDLSNIISEFRDLDYDYVLVNCDTSFVKNQYLFIECDKLFLFDGSRQEVEKTDIFIRYIEEQNMIDTKKVLRISRDNIKNPIQNIIRLINE